MTNNLNNFNARATFRDEGNVFFFFLHKISCNTTQLIKINTLAE
jgi:hypothetical protein